MSRSVIQEKLSFKMLRFTLSSKLGQNSYIASNAETAFKKTAAWIPSMRYLPPDIALYLYKSIIPFCMEYCCHMWAGDPSCHLETLDKLKKQVCRNLLNCWLIVEMLSS